MCVARDDVTLVAKDNPACVRPNRCRAYFEVSAFAQLPSVTGDAARAALQLGVHTLVPTTANRPCRRRLPFRTTPPGQETRGARVRE